MYQSFIIMLSPSNVVFLLFKRYSMPSPSDPPPTREEEKLAARLSLILELARDSDIDVEEEENLEYLDEEPDLATYNPVGAFIPPTPNVVQFGERMIEIDKVLSLDTPVFVATVLLLQPFRFARPTPTGRARRRRAGTAWST